jgi:uncharacterized protein YerC
MRKSSNFNEFVSGDGLLNFCLSVGVFLLVVTYGGIMHRINPNPVAFGYDVLVAIVEAFFFGLATFLIIRQAQKQYIKFIYAMFEGCALFLYYNSPYFGEWANFALTTYISIFGAFTFYSLGYISLYRYKEQLKELAKEAKKQAVTVSNTILDKTGEPLRFVEEKPVIGFKAKAQVQEEEVYKLIQKGMKYRDIAEKTGFALSSINRIKKKYEN